MTQETSREQNGNKPRGNPQAAIAIALGGMIFLVGLGLNVLMFVTQSWPTYLFFILMGWGAIPLAFGIWARKGWERPTIAGKIKKHIAILTILYFFGTYTAWTSSVGVEETVVHEMTWEYGETLKDRPDCKHIVLRFVKWPNHHVGIYSKDLGVYLESLKSNRVPVTFRVTRDWGDVRGYNQTKIGELTSWNSEGGYGGREGDYHPSPWD